MATREIGIIMNGVSGRMGYRQHLVREHCNVDGCFGRAEALVSFGYRDQAFVLIGPRLGVCARHRAHLRPGHMHMIVEAMRRPSRR